MEFQQEPKGGRCLTLQVYRKSNVFCLANLEPLWMSRRMGEPSKRTQILIWLNINSFSRWHRIQCDLIPCPSERNMCSCHLVHTFSSHFLLSTRLMCTSSEWVPSCKCLTPSLSSVGTRSAGLSFQGIWWGNQPIRQRTQASWHTWPFGGRKELVYHPDFRRPIFRIWDAL